VRFLMVCLSFFIFSSCSEILVPPSSTNSNVEDFEFAWTIIDSIYPLLEYKNIDWKTIHTTYRLRARQADGDEFYPVLFDLLAELKDPHVYFLNLGKGLIFPHIGTRYLRDKDAYSPIVVREYFDHPFRSACQGKVEYGIHRDSIGYIYIATFNGKALMNDFKNVMRAIAGTKALIIDVRRNSGGLVENIETVVSKFIASPMQHLSVYLKGNKPATPRSPIQPDISIPRYTGKVVILINGTTISGGEVLAEFMRQLPAVTLLGDTTDGAGCNDIEEDIEGDYFLPSGKYIHIGSTYWLRTDGIPFEWNGIPPDVYLPQTGSDIVNGRDKQLELALTLLR